MVPFNFQLDYKDRLTTFSAEQLDALADATGFMRYEIRSFHLRSVIYVNIEAGTLLPEDNAGYSLEDQFTPNEVQRLAGAIRTYNDSRQLNFDQMAFDF